MAIVDLEHQVLVYLQDGTPTIPSAIPVTNRETKVSPVHFVIVRIGLTPIAKWYSAQCVTNSSMALVILTLT